LTAICTKSFVGWGFAPDFTGGAYSAPTDPLAVFRRPTSKGMARERRRGGSSSFAVGRKKKSRRLCAVIWLLDLLSAVKPPINN